MADSHRRSRLGWIVMGLVFLLAGEGHASSHEWLLGLWSGTYTQRSGSGSCTLTIRDEAGTLKWTWTARAREGKAEAEGVVTKLDASSAELEGRFTSHFVFGYVGTGLKMILKGSASTVSASGITERGNQPTTMELTKRN